MLTARKVRLWSAIHTWTSLVCTAFLLMLCVTGLPLIFHHEIEHLIGEVAEPATMPAGTPHADLDRLLATGLAGRPGDVAQYVLWDKDEPELVHLIVNKAYDGPIENNKVVTLDARTAQVLGQPEGSGFMHVMLKLHVDMFAGLPGKLFLGGMGLTFVIAIVSGVVLYGPFMRRMEFGTVRRQRSVRARWLDLHNLVGVVTLVWALVVGSTGVINTWAELMIKVWQANELSEMIAPYRDKSPPSRFASLQGAVDIARAAAPGMTPSFVAMPGTVYYTSTHHYNVLMRGETPLTARLLKPVLVDAETGALTDTRDLPWYMTALLVSQPLHFGDYGGLPLKILWALLDIATIIVLGSGLYLWLERRRRPAAKIAKADGAAFQAAE